MRTTITTIFQLLLWAAAAWLFVGLLGSMRWLAPSAVPGPDALLAVSLRLTALALFIGGWVMYVRRAEGPHTSDHDMLPYEQATI